MGRRPGPFGTQSLDSKDVGEQPQCDLGCQLAGVKVPARASQRSAILVKVSAAWSYFQL
jgi:hypothetical protein